MFGWRTAVLLVGLVLTAPAAFAQQSDGRGGFYAGLRLVGSVADVNDVSASGFTGTFVENHGSDIVGGGGGVVGYRWDRLPIRAEVELAHRVRFDWDSRDNGPPAVGYQNNLDSTNLLFNVMFEYRNMSAFTPFAGATLGWARNHSSVERSVVGTANVMSQDNSENNLAWGFILGLDWAFARHWSAEFAYRYINLGEASTGVFPTGEEIKADSYTAHDLLLSALYRW